MAQQSYAFLGQRLARKRLITCTDLDKSFTLDDKNPSRQELNARAKSRKKAESMGLFGFQSGRTPELMWSSGSFSRSAGRGFSRPVPHWGVGNGSRNYETRIELIRGFKHSYDPAFCYNWGTGIHLLQADGSYLEDKSYLASLGGSDWRTRVMALLFEIDQEGELRTALSPLEFEQNYRDLKSNVFPLPYRVQLHFRGPDGAKHRDTFTARIKKLQEKEHPLAQNVLVVSDTDPTGKRHLAYLVPLSGSKARGLDHLLYNLGKASGVNPSTINVVLAGDRLSDYEAATSLSVDMPVTFIAMGKDIRKHIEQAERLRSTRLGVKKPLQVIFADLATAAMGHMHC